MKIIGKYKLIIIPVVLAILLFWKSVFLGQVPFPGNYLLVWHEPWKTLYTKNGVPILPHKAVLDDVFRQLYQYKTLSAEIVRLGQFPLWNPYGGAGMPLMAVMHAGFLTPLILLFVSLPGWAAWALYIGLQPIVVAFGMLLYFRQLGIRLLASVFATVAFLFSGFAIVRYQYGEYLYVGACLPLLLAIVERYSKNRKTLSVWGIPFVIVFMVISGQPQMILYVLAF